METNSEVYLSKKRFTLLLALYFIVYLLFIPNFLKHITLLLNPHATIVNLYVSFFIHIIFLCICIYVSKPVWINSIHAIRNNKLNCIKCFLKYTIFIVVLNAFLGLILSFFTKTSTSENQIAIAENARIAPIFICFISGIFAPILEETIFRGGVFCFFRQRHSYFISMLISSFLFGFIHVMESLFTGNFNDLVYLFLYMGLGMVLSKSYEKTHSLLVSIGVHMGNNFLGLIGLFLSL